MNMAEASGLLLKKISIVSKFLGTEKMASKLVNKSQSLVSHKLSAMLKILSNAFIVKQMSTMNL